jgi:hypothetical protein
MYEASGDNFDLMIAEQIVNNIAHMDIGEVADCDGLLGPDLWKTLTELERNFLFRRTVDRLVNEGTLDLEFADCDGYILYRKT